MSDTGINAPIPQQLIQELHRLYPHRCPRRGESLEDIHRYAGAVALVDYLAHCFERQYEKGVKFADVYA